MLGRDSSAWTSDGMQIMNATKNVKMARIFLIYASSFQGNAVVFYLAIMNASEKTDNGRGDVPKC